MAKQSNTEKMAEVVERLTEMVTATGTLPWNRPWVAAELSVPTSAVTGKAYRGVNYWTLGMAGQMIAPTEPNVWATYKQIKAEGGQVRKGEKSMVAVLWKPVEKVVDGEKEKFLLLRTFNVFHWTQADWESEPREVRKARERMADRPNAAEAHAAAELVIEGYLSNGGPRFEEGGDRAFYSPAQDKVVVPEADQFLSTDGRYRTIFHELAHSTGHKDRLAREGVTDISMFGSERYSREELVAEMTAAILADHVGIDSAGDGGHNGETNSAAYIQSWLKALKDDPMALSHASGRSLTAAEHIIEAGLAEEAAVA